jgi:hypothetical protein
MLEQRMNRHIHFREMSEKWSHDLSDDFEYDLNGQLDSMTHFSA